jgi:hypothetical protein
VLIYYVLQGIPQSLLKRPALRRSGKSGESHAA